MEIKLKSAPATNRPLVVLFAAFVLAVIHQYLFYENEPGVSYPIFVILLYVYMWIYAKDQMNNQSRFTWLLLGTILLLTMTYLLFNNPFFHALNLVVIPALIFLHMTLLLSYRQLDWGSIRIAANALDHLIPQTFRHWPTAVTILKSSLLRQMGDRHKHVLGKVMIGLAIALPLLIIITKLLASADGVFNQLMSTIPDWMGNLSFGEGIARLIWTCLIGLFLFGYLWGFREPRKVESDQDGQMESVDTGNNKIRKIDPIIIVTVLISINLVYVLFVVVQFSYLFGGLEGVLPEGSSYAEYARSGFFELVVVSLINFIIMLVTLVCGGDAHGLLKKFNNGMLYILVGCSGIMLYSAYMRLVLYEQVYGYTYIRFLVHAFMLYLGLLLIIAGLRIRLQSFPIAKAYIVISLVAYVIMNYVGMDRIIAAKNIERFRDSGKIDTAYLRDLSTDATALLIRFSKEEHPAMESGLRRNLANLSRDNRAWPSFNLSRYRAERALERYFND
jgi:hypothetical protein